MSDLEKTQHYTVNADYILQGLIDYIPKDAKVVEPFVGNGDLLGCFPNWDSMYDIEPSSKVPETTQRNTLTFPPDYHDKWIITNPPFLAENKATDKELFKQYGYDDLYKIALHSFIGCEGGVVIVPLNFFTDEYSSKIRQEFLSRYYIDKVNIFKKPVFPSTSYSVCAFAFHRERNQEQNVFFFIPEENTEFHIRLDTIHDYRFGGVYYDYYKSRSDNYFSRLLKDKEPEGFVTNLKLYALDTREAPIHIAYEEEPYYGKSTDRIYLTFVCKKELNEKTQKELMNAFNCRINRDRERYHNLLFTNYRDYNRKRISFNLAYKMLSHELNLIEQERTNSQ